MNKSHFSVANWRYGVVSAALCLLFYFYLTTLQFFTAPEVVKQGDIVSGVVEKEAPKELTKEEIAKAVGCGIATVYRVAKANE